MPFNLVGTFDRFRVFIPFQGFYLKLTLIAALLTFGLVAEAQDKLLLKQKEINKRLNYLKRVVNEPLDDQSEVMKLGRFNHEFLLFSYSYASYAVTNLAVRDSAYTPEAIALIKTAIQRVYQPKVALSFGIQVGGKPGKSTSVLYLGHLNLMLGCYRRLSSDTTFDHLNDSLSSALANRYQQTDYLQLESYPSAIWIPDNSVAMASLKLHSFNTGSHYDSLCTAWAAYVKKRYLHQETQVLYSTVHHGSGARFEEPRGSMLGWSTMFIYQFDPEYARSLYNNYKKYFSRNYLFFRLFKERYQDRSTHAGDIDSGPLFRGYSIPANEFALGGAVLSGDLKTARRMKRLICFGARKIRKGDEIRYKIRFVKLDISPMAEAIVLYSLTMTRSMMRIRS